VCIVFQIALSLIFARYINPLNAKLNPICHLLALLGAHHIFHVSRIRVKVEMNISAITEKFNNPKTASSHNYRYVFCGFVQKKIAGSKSL